MIVRALNSLMIETLYFSSTIVDVLKKKIDDPIQPNNYKIITTIGSRYYDSI